MPVTLLGVIVGAFVGFDTVCISSLVIGLEAD